MNPTSKKDFMANICMFYLDFLKELYQENSVIDSQKYKNQIASEVAEQ